MVKAIHNQFSTYIRKATPAMPYWELKYALDYLGEPAIYHPGAVRLL